MPGSVSFRPPQWALLLCGALAILGALTFAFGLFQAPQRAWANVLLLSNYLIDLSTGSLVLVALFYVTGARWSVPLRRLPEALAIALPVAGVGLAAVLLFRPSLYAWTAHSAAEEHVSPLRALWLNRPFFLLRALAYLAIWQTFAMLIVRNSHLQDRTSDPAATRSNMRLSAGFLVAFGVTCWLSSHDWLMSLEPDWSSTIFAIYHFAGLFLSALAAVTLLAVWFRRAIPLPALSTGGPLADLGTLLFGFSCFWMYTWFCQYLLIWYTNHPEETSYFQRRSDGPWPALLFLALGLNWGVPFVVLLFRAAKRSPVLLAAVALVVLAGRWVDLYLVIFPTQGEVPHTPGWIEVGLALGAGGIFAATVLHALTLAPLAPGQGSPLAGITPEGQQAPTATPI